MSRLLLSRSGFPLRNICSKASPSSFYVNCIRLVAAVSLPSQRIRASFFSSQSSPSDAGPSNAGPHASSSTDASSQSVKPDIRALILAAAMKHVNRVGWTNAALAAGVSELGLSPASVGMFARGPIELVEHFIESCNSRLPVTLQESKIQEVRGVTNKIRAALKLRLQMQIPVLSTWHQAMALGALPQNVPSTVNNIARMIDDVWHFAGDRSTDMNWYSKRALAGAVYASTEIFMLTDRSADYADTWAFLDRRLEDVMEFGRVSGHVRDAGAALASVASSAAPSVFSMLSALMPHARQSAPSPQPSGASQPHVPADSSLHQASK